jgi:hypothetical protein
MNTMTSWTSSEEATLLAEIKTIPSLYEIARKHGRTPNAIQMRLHRIVSRCVLSGTACPLDEIRAFLNKKPQCETQLPISLKFAETFDRKKLQGLAEEHRRKELVAFIERNITNHLLSSATLGGRSFFYERPPADLLRRQNQYCPTDDELVDGLKAKFPGSEVTVTEEWVDEPLRRAGAPHTRVLKKGIKICWA